MYVTSLAPLLTSCMLSERPLNVSKAQFLHLHNGNNSFVVIILIIRLL